MSLSLLLKVSRQGFFLWMSANLEMMTATGEGKSRILISNRLQCAVYFYFDW